MGSDEQYFPTNPGVDPQMICEAAWTLSSGVLPIIAQADYEISVQEHRFHTESLDPEGLLFLINRQETNGSNLKNLYAIVQALPEQDVVSYRGYQIPDAIAVTDILPPGPRRRQTILDYLAREIEVETGDTSTAQK